MQYPFPPQTIRMVHHRSFTIVTPAQVVDILPRLKKTHSRGLVPLDSTWYMPNVAKNGFEEFSKQRLTNNAVFFDIDKIKDDSNKFPHMLPTHRQFQAQLSELGLSSQDSLLIYDQQGIFSCCRAAWMFEVMGHNVGDIFILNTFPKLVADEKLSKELVIRTPTDSETPFKHSVFQTEDLHHEKVVRFEDLLELVKGGKVGAEVTVVDARSADRFTGEAPEPRPIPSGHIPGSVNLPFPSLLTQEKSFKSPQELRDVFASVGVTESHDKKIIVMCGTGVTACVLRVGLDIAGLGSKGVAVYDGSWT